MKLVGLDVLRAVAVLSVVFNHYMLEEHSDYFSNFIMFSGPLRVQIFFSLSGFLIGNILLKVIDTPAFSAWLRFMLRRWLRTLPLYFTVFSLLVLMSSADSDLRANYLYMMTMTQNFFSDPPPGYGVVWSLAVEEIFYIVFSIMLFVGCALIGKKAIWVTIWLFILTPLLCRFSMDWVGHVYPEKNALLSLDGIAWGVFMAVLYRNKNTLFYNGSFCFSLAILLICESSIGSWGSINFTLEALGCSLMISPFLKLKSLGKAEETITTIARYSYGCYLLHVPLIIFCSFIENEVVRLLILFVLLTTTVYVFNIMIEKPFLKLRPEQNAPIKS